MFTARYGLRSICCQAVRFFWCSHLDLHYQTTDLPFPVSYNLPVSRPFLNTHSADIPDSFRGYGVSFPPPFFLSSFHIRLQMFKWKVKNSLKYKIVCLYAMKTCRGVGVQVHLFLICRWTISYTPVCFTPGEGTPVPLNRGLGGPGAGLEVLDGSKVSCASR